MVLDSVLKLWGKKVVSLCTAGHIYDVGVLIMEIRKTERKVCRRSI
jgi:hypothetical protein